MNRILGFLVALLPLPALAQEVFPALYDVAGVAADDELNLRSAPGAGADRIGSLAADATGIEVIALSEDGKWGRVNAGESSGWAAMTYLTRQPGQMADDWTATAERVAPRTLDCFGTEPFWNLALAPGKTLEYAALGRGDGTAVPGGYEPLGSSASTDRRGFFGWVETDPLGFTGIIANRLCSDGMSDRSYGLAIDLIVSGPEGDDLITGCCRLVP